MVAVGPKGEGAAAAVEPLGRLSGGGLERLEPLLAAFDDAGPVSRNLLAGAVQAVADEGQPVALVAALEHAARTRVAPRSRRPRV